MAKNAPNTESLDDSTIGGVPAPTVPETDWSVMDYEAALAMFEGQTVTADAETMGDGFVKLIDKKQLVGVPFFIVKGTFTEGVGKFGEKVTIRVITKDKRKFFFSDGSTGIYSQLRKLVPEARTFGGVECPKGLRESAFHWDDKLKQITKDGEPNSSTFYIDVSG